jgi:integrase/recombinase XerD
VKTALAIQEFIDSRISANLSPATIIWYRNRLLPFVEACLVLPRRPEPVESFMAGLKGSPETKWDVYRALKTFYKFISIRRLVPNPMDAIKPPRRPKTLMPTLESGEMMKILNSSESSRDKAILTLIMDNGVRAGEVCSLLKHNIRQETLIVNGKTGWREVPISEETRLLLLQIAASSPDDYVFHGHKGPITRHLIYEITRRHIQRVGIKGPKMGPHRLRHAFGKNFLVEGGDLRSLQEILGHADIKTTEKYATLNLTDIINKHRKFSPLRAVHAAEQAALLNTDDALKEAEAILLEAKGDGGKGNKNTD